MNSRDAASHNLHADSFGVNHMNLPPIEHKLAIRVAEVEDALLVHVGQGVVGVHGGCYQRHHPDPGNAHHHQECEHVHTTFLIVLLNVLGEFDIDCQDSNAKDSDKHVDEGPSTREGDFADVCRRDLSHSTGRAKRGGVEQGSREELGEFHQNPHIAKTVRSKCERCKIIFWLKPAEGLAQ